VLPTRELAPSCYQRVNGCGAPGFPGYDQRITPGPSSSAAPPTPAPKDAPDDSDRPLTTLRGASVDVDPRLAARVAVVVLVAALAAVAISLSVAGFDKNAEIRALRQQGTPVEVTVTHCIALLGGSGSNGVGDSCLGTFVLDGKRYGSTIPGNALWAPGSTLRLITIRSNPGLLATSHQVASEHDSWRLFILPAVLVVALIALVGAIIARRVRRRRRPGTVASVSTPLGAGLGGKHPLLG
jgi:hypothetical protein